MDVIASSTNLPINSSSDSWVATNGVIEAYPWEMSIMSESDLLGCMEKSLLLAGSLWSTGSGCIGSPDAFLGGMDFACCKSSAIDPDEWWRM